MLVYGDIVRTRTPDQALAEVREDLARAAGLTGIERHAALVSALIGLGELAQGSADAELAERGVDASSPLLEALMGALLALAEAVATSWEGGEPAAPELDLPPLPDARLTLKQPEGYAFYALYPEAYLEAARTLPAGPDWQVVGVRSIGTSLAAMVAQGLGASAALTVRPIGHPFDRQLALSPELERRISATRRVAIVDEGPGLSGSSFGAVLDIAGVAGSHVFPGHAGDLGPQAPEARRARWAVTPRHVAGFDDVILPRLQPWAEDLVGPATAPLQDLSGGAWRTLRRQEAAPANAAQERRKFLHRTAKAAWLLRFAGLGRIGERKLARARALHVMGFTPAPAGLRHGFLVERWIEPAPLPDGPPPLLEYLILRRMFEAAPEAGASIEALLEMARVNTAEALGEAAAEPLERFRPDLERLAGLVKRVETDGRLHAWEWIGTPQGRWLKTDALDHHAAHDLVGAQDIAWDVAGAEVEWSLDPGQAERLARELDAEPDLLNFYRPCYLAFQLGYYAMAADAHAGWPDEAQRLRQRSAFYRDRLERLLVDGLAPSG